MLVGLAVSVIEAVSPGVVSVIGTVIDWEILLASAVTVAVPSVVPAIKDTITMPVSSDVETEMLVLPEKLPRSVVNVTVVPLWTGLPELS